MQNLGGETFDYSSFRAAHETDPRIKTMVKNFNQDGIEPKTKANQDEDPGAGDAQADQDPGNDDVAQTAMQQAAQSIDQQLT